MSEYVIVTDSSLDMNDKLVKELGVEVLPLTYTMKGQDYKNWPDHREMPLKEFYQSMRDGELVTTAAINVFEYKESLTPILKAGKDVLLMVFDKAISAGTFQSANLAVEDLREEFPERKILLEDTLCTTAGLYLMLRYATDLQKAGGSMEEVQAWCEEHKRQICHCFTVEDLKYLRRGGRISATTAVVGGMLNIKPILHMDREGYLTSIDKARGRGAALKALAALVEKHITEKELVAICHADCLEETQALAEEIQTRTGVKEVLIGDLGPVIGAHTGPGLVVVGFLGTERTAE